MNIKKLTTLAFAGLLLAGAIFTTGCGEKSPGEKAGEALEDAGDAIKDATN